MASAFTKNLALGLSRAAIALLTAWSTAAVALESNAPVRLVVGFGGSAEGIVRLLAPRISEALGGQPVVVEPMTAAAGMVAARTVARSAPNGHTILVVGSNAMMFRPLTMRSPPYDPVKDFTPISRLTVSAFSIAVHPKLGIRNFADFVAFAKRSPVPVTLGMSGSPSINDLNRILIEQAIPGVKLASVAYKEEGQAVVDAIAGHINGAIISTSNLAGAAKEGKLTPIAILADERRYPFEDIPAIGEVVPGVRPFSLMTGFWGPAGMPEPVLARLNQAIVQALGDKETNERIRTMWGSLVRPTTPEQLQSIVTGEIDRVRESLRTLDFKPE
jgi:tripartite-type tricarboxylate transporter receptor subunit TctC